MCAWKYWALYVCESVVQMWIVDEHDKHKGHGRGEQGVKGRFWWLWLWPLQWDLWRRPSGAAPG